MTYLLFEPERTHLRALVPSKPAMTARVAQAVAAVMVGVVGVTPARADDVPNLTLGRHLAAECTACHVANPAPGTAGIPSIKGRPAAEIIASLQAYASGTLSGGRPANAAMASVAQSLDPAQMAAVAAYLATLPSSP